MNLRMLIVGDEAANLHRVLTRQSIDGIEFALHLTRAHEVEPADVVAKKLREGAHVQKMLSATLEKLQESAAITILLPSAPEAYMWLGAAAILPRPTFVLFTGDVMYQPIMARGTLVGFTDLESYLKSVRGFVELARKARDNAGANDEEPTSQPENEASSGASSASGSSQKESSGAEDSGKNDG